MLALATSRGSAGLRSTFNIGQEAAGLPDAPTEKRPMRRARQTTAGSRRGSAASLTRESLGIYCIAAGGTKSVVL
jgi:hypothetical protein